MTIQDLKKIINKLPDDTTIVVPSNDHGYRNHIRVMSEMAIFDRETLTISEDWDVELDKNQKRIKVLVIE